MRRALRFAAGAAIGVALWVFASGGYNAILATFAEPLLRIDSRLRGVEVLSSGQRIFGRGDVDPTIPGVVIPAGQLTYNIVLLLGLFATNEAALALDRELAGPIIGPSSYFFKTPPKQFRDDICREKVEDFISGKSDE